MQIDIYNELVFWGASTDSSILDILVRVKEKKQNWMNCYWLDIKIRHYEERTLLSDCHSFIQWITFGFKLCIQKNVSIISWDWKWKLP